jgi:tRNA-dihydrouridine synthase B
MLRCGEVLVEESDAAKAKEIKIGPIKTHTNVFLASMAGCTDLSFRLIAREMGAQFCFFEMSDSNSLVYGSGRKTADMLQAHPRDLPIAAQLLGSDPEIMLKAAKKLIELNNNISFLDINAACPIKKVIKKKAGAYLIKEPEMLYRIIDKLSSSLAIPITIKLRTGYLEKDPEHIVSIAKNCEQNGAKVIFVHGRTKAQAYSGDVDHGSIKAIKANVKIPVIASGNIFSAQKAKEMIDLTQCDGVLVARGACGNPWIFAQIKNYLKKGALLPDPTLKEKLAVLTKHLQYIEKYKLLSAKVGFSRKVANWYLKHIKDAAVLRSKVVGAKSFQELYQLIDDLAASSIFSS